MWCTGLAAPRHVGSGSGIEPVSPALADSLPLGHQGSPYIFKGYDIFYTCPYFHFQTNQYEQVVVYDFRFFFMLIQRYTDLQYMGSCCSVCWLWITIWVKYILLLVWISLTSKVKSIFTSLLTSSLILVHCPLDYHYAINLQELFGYLDTHHLFLIFLSYHFAFNFFVSCLLPYVENLFSKMFIFPCIFLGLLLKKVKISP